MATIYIIKGPNDGDTFTIGEETITIGRGEECSVTLNDEKTSRQHLQISFDPVSGKHMAEDMKSTNGTWCNGKTLDSMTPLSHGAELELGSSVIEYSTRTFETNEAAMEARKSEQGAEIHPTLIDDTNRPF